MLKRLQQRHLRQTTDKSNRKTNLGLSVSVILHRSYHHVDHEILDIQQSTYFGRLTERYTFCRLGSEI